MDRIWDRKSLEVGSHWPWHVAGMKKNPNDHAGSTKVER